MAGSGFIRIPLRCFNHVSYSTPRQTMFSRRMSSSRSFNFNFTSLCQINSCNDRQLNRIFTRPFSESSYSHPSLIKDDSHPSLFYHFIHPPNRISEKAPAFALSFLEERPTIEASRTILGWLPAQGEAEATGEGEGEGEGSGLNDFVENNEFVNVLHDVLRKTVFTDELWINAAMQMQSGWMHIFDQRNPPPLGRIPDPDDIIATILVENSIMIRDTYQPMPSYRLCTGDGVCLLSEKLLSEVKKELGRINSVERGG